MTSKIELTQTFEEVCFSLSEVELHGIKKGNENQPIVLCLHGWLDNADSFSNLAPLLADYHVVAVDLPCERQACPQVKRSILKARLISGLRLEALNRSLVGNFPLVSISIPMSAEIFSASQDLESPEITR